VTLDVAVCTRDRREHLRRCLASVAAQTTPPRRILVVNGGDPLGSLGVPAEVVDAEPGLPHQRNVALDLLDGDIVAFLDDDVELRPEYVERVLTWFAEHPQTVGVSGNIDNDVPFTAASRAFRRAFCLSTGDGILRSSGEVIYLRRPAAPARVQAVSGSNMVWRRASIQRLRFDESLEGYAYMEDVDFSLRAGLKGELWMLPNAHLVHHRTETSRVPPRAYVRQVFGNGAYLFAKHRRAYGLRPPAYVRRVLGRSAFYLTLAARTGSAEPLIGLGQGIAAIPGALRRGRLVGDD
jgi:GT2 family glycosyltransferase